MIFFSCDVGDYQDCNSVINGGAYFDECGNCVGGKTGLAECTTDCNGILGGTSFLNPCDICVEGNTGINLDSCSSLSYNGEIYRTIIIGNQVWLGEDLRTKNFFAETSGYSFGFFPMYTYNDDKNKWELLTDGKSIKNNNYYN